MKRPRVQFGDLDIEEIEDLAEALHRTKLGCDYTDWNDPRTGASGHDCSADHNAQAQVLLRAMIRSREM